MYKAAVIGDRDSILGFKALGIDVFDEKHTKPGEIVKELAEKNYAVVFVTEDILYRIEDAMEKYSDSPLPAIIPIPGNKGSKGLGMNNIRKAAEKAIGADILFNDK
ncbi:MAG: V-type ATP synthase subunit F [Clostridia bacterium]|nr:V-type ATP synthase subunit F [Clostridia bacterium]